MPTQVEAVDVYSNARTLVELRPLLLSKHIAGGGLALDANDLSVDKKPYLKGKVGHPRRRLGGLLIRLGWLRTALAPRPHQNHVKRMEILHESEAIASMDR